MYKSVILILLYYELKVSKLMLVKRNCVYSSNFAGVSLVYLIYVKEDSTQSSNEFFWKFVCFIALALSLLCANYLIKEQAYEAESIY